MTRRTKRTEDWIFLVGLAIMIYALIMITITSCNHHKHSCGTVQTKVWSHVTGHCYVIVSSFDDPPEQLYLVLDTARWDYVNLGDWYCGRTLTTE